MFSRLLAIMIGVAVSSASLADEPSTAPTQPVPTQQPGTADQATPADQAIAAQFEKVVAGLDGSDFFDRAAAERQLSELTKDAAQSAELSQLVQAKLLKSSLSFEVRARLEELGKRLPIASVQLPKDITDTELEQLVSDLDAGSSSLRLSAERRLSWLAQSPDLALRIWRRLDEKLQAGSAEADSDSVSPLGDLRDEMQTAWLAAGGNWRDLPQTSELQITRWVDALTLMEDDYPTRSARLALKQLKSAALRDDQLETIRSRLQAVREGIATDEETVDVALIDEMLEFVHPSMVAEVWNDHRIVNLQYLLVNVPQFNMFGRRSTHFDRIDDESANCVSGNNLSPGEYRVGVANTKSLFIEEPPNFSNLQHLYHLVNLPNARRRAVYRHRFKRDQRMQLAEMSQRTVDWYLTRETPLKETEIITLAQLDADVVSKFALNYFRTVEDRKLPEDSPGLTGQPTVQRSMTFMLSRIGTASALPALEHQAQGLQLSEESPVNVAWMAALAIAVRIPGREVDDWLARTAERDDALVFNFDRDVNLGVAAAALLLRRHDRSPYDFGLEQLDNTGPLGPPRSEHFGLKVFRGTAAQREEIIRWWEKQKAETVVPAG